MEKQQKKKTDAKERIAQKAKELFSQKGYAATSIEDIIAAAGSSKGNVYYHFGSKEKLFLYLIEEDTKEWMEKWQKKQEQYATTADKLYGLAEHYVDDFQNPLLKAGEEFSGSQTADPETLQELLVLMRMQRTVYHSIVEEGITSGEFKQMDVQDATLILFGLLAGLGANYYEMELEEIRALYRKAITVFLHGIKPENTR